MVCVLCGSKTSVINSRGQKRNNQVWRRRLCLGCRTVFTTEETVDYGAIWRIKPKTGPLEPFNRDKLLISVKRSLEHRKTALQDAKGLSETIIGKLIGVANNGVIDTETIAQASLVALSRFDRAASTHYAALHHM